MEAYEHEHGLRPSYLSTSLSASKLPSNSSEQAGAVVGDDDNDDNHRQSGWSGEGGTDEEGTDEGGMDEHDKVVQRDERSLQDQLATDTLDTIAEKRRRSRTDLLSYGTQKRPRRYS